MKKTDLAAGILSSVKNFDKAHVSDFNRKVLTELAYAEFTGDVNDDSVETAVRLLQTFLNDTWPEEPEAHKYVIGSCLALAFLFERPLHPQEVTGYVTRMEEGKEAYYCAYKEKGTICDFCAAGAETMIPVFRKMRRFRQQISEEDCIRILKDQKRGVLSVIGDGGYPYGIPLDHWYSEEDNKLYFHCAGEGHKIDAITACDKVSYCVMDEGFRKDGEWALNINSVIVFGRMRIVEDEDRKREICTNLSRKFTDDEAYIQKELASSFPRVNCLELTIEHMTGKLVNES